MTVKAPFGLKTLIAVKQLKHFKRIKAGVVHNMDTTPNGRPLTAEEIAAQLSNQLATETDLRKQAEADLQAVRSEFASAGSAEEAVKLARKFIEDSLPEAVIEIRNLIHNAESESVRASLSKFVVTSVLDKKHEEKTPDELKELIASLRHPSLQQQAEGT